MTQAIGGMNKIRMKVIYRIHNPALLVTGAVGGIIKTWPEATCQNHNHLGEAALPEEEAIVGGINKH